MVYALVEICVPFPLIAAGEQHVSSSLAAILIAAVPLLVAAAGDPLRCGRARRTAAASWGSLVGFAGVVALVGLDVAGDTDELIGAGAILVAAIGLRGRADGPEAQARATSSRSPMMGAATGRGGPGV